MIERFISYQSYTILKKILKRALEYIILIIICALISSIVFAYEFKDYNEYIKRQLILNSLLTEAVEVLDKRIRRMEDMRGI